MHMAFTLTQKRRAQDKVAKRYNKLVDAVKKVWPRNPGSIAALRGRKSVKRMQGFEKDLLRKVNDPTDAMDLEHAIQELCDTKIREAAVVTRMRCSGYHEHRCSALTYLTYRCILFSG
ncbi:hypothetical protein NCS52_00887200 [Fusarium sp. LHS14.1]|nr:hypothetical protein NCS52_00887200 [Fusarium sp. LHS14.1]